MTNTLEQDRALLAGCFTGDKEAAETLVRRFSNLVYQAIQHTLIVRQVPFAKEDLEDFHNIVFLRLFEKGCKRLKQYQGKNGCSLATWIRLITLRVVLDHLRKKGVDSFAGRNAQIALDEAYGLRGDESDALARLEIAEKGRVLREGIEKLPSRDRLFIKLHFEQGLPIGEIAVAMHTTTRNVYVVKHRAIKKLKAQVSSSAGK
jgi:RNA polymerase sigma factor (sigma-70 family)